MRILLLDNEQDGLHGLGSSIGRRFGKVDCAASLQTGKTFFSGNDYDLVIVALEMDGNEGYSFLEHLEATRPEQRTITFSAEEERPSANGGCFVCRDTFQRKRLLKPLDLRHLYQLIEHFDRMECPMAGQAVWAHGHV